MGRALQVWMGCVLQVWMGTRSSGMDGDALFRYGWGARGAMERFIIEIAFLALLALLSWGRGMGRRGREWREWREVALYN